MKFYWMKAIELRQKKKKKKKSTGYTLNSLSPE